MGGRWRALTWIWSPSLVAWGLFKSERESEETDVCCSRAGWESGEKAEERRGAGRDVEGGSRGRASDARGRNDVTARS